MYNIQWTQLSLHITAVVIIKGIDEDKENNFIHPVSLLSVVFCTTLMHARTRARARGTVVGRGSSKEKNNNKM